MRVKWTEFPSLPPEEYWDSWNGEPIPVNHYSGEVINSVRAFGETRLVVALDSGRIVQVGIDNVTRE